MTTPIVGWPDESGETLRRCAETLRRPGAVALVPTETVYGLVTRWEDASGIDRIYALKDRDRSKPLAMFGADAAVLEAAGGVVTHAARRLIERFCPGPITLVVADRRGGTLGFRCPDHALIRQLLATLGFPLASTSANHSGHPNALTVAEALAMLNGDVGIAADAGPLPSGARASTVVDVSGTDWKVLREGPVSTAELARVLN